MAPTVWLPSIVTVQVVAVTGVQLEEKPPNVDPPDGVALKVTTDPEVKYAVQLVAAPLTQSMAVVGAVLAIVPAPAPTVYAVREGRLFGLAGFTEPGSTFRLDVPTTSATGVQLWFGGHSQLVLLTEQVAVITVEHTGGKTGELQLSAVAKPPAEAIVATPVALDCQVTESVTSPVTPLLYVP